MNAPLSIEDRVRKIISDYAGLNPLRVTRDANMISDLEFDDLDTREVLMGCEEEFGIEIVEHIEPDNLNTVGDLVDHIETHTTEKP